MLVLFCFMLLFGLPHFPPGMLDPSCFNITLPKYYFARCVRFSFSHLPCVHHPLKQAKYKACKELVFTATKNPSSLPALLPPLASTGVFSLFGPLFSANPRKTGACKPISAEILWPDINYAALRLTSLPFLPHSDAQLTLRQVLFTTSTWRSASTCCFVIGWVAFACWQVIARQVCFKVGNQRRWW